MKSGGLDKPSWTEWESCYILTSAQEDDLSSNPNKSVRLDNAFDLQKLDSICGQYSVSTTAVLQAAFALTLHGYVDNLDVCFGREDDQQASAVRHRLDLSKSLIHAVDHLERIALSTEPSGCGLGDYPLPFDTILSLSRPGFELVEGVPDDGKPFELSNELDVSCCSCQDGSKMHHQANATSTKLSWDSGLLVTFIVDGTTITATYPSSKWNCEQATSVVKVFSCCIQELVKHPHRTMRDLDWIPPTQRTTILRWNNKVFDNYELRIPDIVAERTATAPQALAVASWDGNLTYTELDILASRLAQRLIAGGLRGNETVAFLFHKSKWNIVAILAILKAGAAATALDPAQPLSRWTSILASTEARWILVGQDLESGLELSHLTKMVIDERLAAADDNEAESAFIVAHLKPQHLAFIQFTSGSSGNLPKGVKIEHRTYVANAISQQQACGMDSKSRVLQFASHSFDAVLVEVLTTLMAGACVCVPSEDARLNHLSDTINDLQVNWIGITPNLAKTLVPPLVPSLKTLVFWGEPAAQELISTWISHVRLINIYGPSENSVIATSHDFSNSRKRYIKPSHIGHAVKACNTWVVRTDNRQRLAPIGTVGELVLQGATPAQGYLHDPGQQTSMFGIDSSWLPSRYVKKLHQRLYFTGDLVRYNEDGSLDIIGRSDSQVKIRGHRVDLANIEHQIQQSTPQVKEAVVDLFAPAGSSDRRVLAAFIVPKDATQHNSACSRILAVDQFLQALAVSIQKHLIDTLTPESVPSFYLPLNRIPISANGKIDRKSLKRLGTSMSEDELLTCSATTRSKRSAVTQSEILAAELWAECLSVSSDSLSLDDSFLRIGWSPVLFFELCQRDTVEYCYNRWSCVVRGQNDR